MRSTKWIQRSAGKNALRVHNASAASDKVRCTNIVSDLRPVRRREPYEPNRPGKIYETRANPQSESGVSAPGQHLEPQHGGEPGQALLIGGFVVTASGAKRMLICGAAGPIGFVLHRRLLGVAVKNLVVGRTIGIAEKLIINRPDPFDRCFERSAG